MKRGMWLKQTNKNTFLTGQQLISLHASRSEKGVRIDREKRGTAAVKNNEWQHWPLTKKQNGNVNRVV